MKLTQNLSKDEKKMIRSMFWRSSTMYISVNPVLMGGGGFCFSLMPLINKFYKNNEEGRRKALERETSYFSTTVPMSTFVMGIAASMEKENSQEPDFNADSINAVKTSLMGPLAGIGDSLFWGVWRAVCAALAINFARSGNFLAPIIFLVMFNIPNYIIRYYGGFLGYSLGSSYVKKLYENGLMNVLTKAASILGLVMVGAMTVQMVIFKTTIKWTMGGKTIMNVQSVLDQIFEGLLPVAITLVCYKLLKDKKIGVITLIFAIVILSVLASLIGIV